MNNFQKRKNKVTEEVKKLAEEIMPAKSESVMTHNCVTLHEVTPNQEYILLSIDYNLQSGDARVNLEKSQTLKTNFPIALQKFKLMLGEKLILKKNL